MRPIAASRGLITAAVAGAACAALMGWHAKAVAGSSEMPVPPPDTSPGLEDRLLMERQWLDDVASAWIGRDYGCAAVLPRRRPRVDPTLVIFVAGRGARGRAERLRGALEHPERVSVEHTTGRKRLVTMRRIARRVDARRPAAAVDVSTGLVGFPDVTRGDCPPLRIELGEAAQASAPTRRWARWARRRFGRDRVIIRRVAGSFRPA